MNSQRKRRFVAGAGAGALLLLLSPAMAMVQGSAAHLEVDGGVAQYFEFDGPGSLPLPDELLPPAECGDPEDYDEIVHGTEGDDILYGGNGRQIILGLGGNDTLHGENGMDCLVGGDGEDILDGGNAKDILLGGEGADILDGGNGKDILLGGDGDDTLYGDNGKDLMYGGAGEDTCHGGNAQDKVDCELPVAEPGASAAGVEAHKSELLTDDADGTDDEIAAKDPAGDSAGDSAGGPGEDATDTGDGSEADDSAAHSPGPAIQRSTEDPATAPFDGPSAGPADGPSESTGPDDAAPTPEECDIAEQDQDLDTLAECEETP